MTNFIFAHFQDQAQTACFSSDGEVIVIGMTSGKWMVLDASTREVFGIFQDGSDAIQVFTPKDLELESDFAVTSQIVRLKNLPITQIVTTKVTF